MAWDKIWDFISEYADEHYQLPTWDFIAESLDNVITLDDFDLIDQVMKSYIRIHTLEGVENQYEGSFKWFKEI